MGRQNEPDSGSEANGGGLTQHSGPSEAPSPALAGISLQINKDNVRQVRATILHAVDHAKDTLSEARARMRLEPCAEDPVSEEAAAAWNARLVDAPDSYAERLQQYVDSLYHLCDQLEDTAKQYGYTEEEITNTFKDKSV